MTRLREELDPLSFGGTVRRLLPQDRTIADLARAVDASYSYFHSLIKGERAGKRLRPSREMVEKVVAALKEIGVQIGAQDETILNLSSSGVSDTARSMVLFGEILPPFTGANASAVHDQLATYKFPFEVTSEERDLILRLRSLPAAEREHVLYIIRAVTDGDERLKPQDTAP